MGRVRWIVLAVLVLVVGGAVALVLVEQPKLDDARGGVDRAWQPLRAPTALVVRYQKLEGALSAFDAAGGRGRAVSVALHAGLQAWSRALADGDAGDQVTAANTLEGQGERLRLDVDGTDRFHTVQAINDALASFEASRPAQALVDTYNASVRHYEKVRTALLARAVARVLGFGPRALFAMPRTASG